MDTWDNAQPDRDEPIGDASAIPEEGSPAGSPAGSRAPAPHAAPDLRRALNLIADHYAAAPHHDLFPQVLARAARIRRRRRAIRAGSATAMLVVAAVLAPSIASQLGVHGGAASAAPPPSAIVDLTSAYPVPAAARSDDAVAVSAQPENALTWPSRGAAVPAQAMDVAKSYLLDHVEKSDAPTTTATVTTLWAQVDEDTAAAAAPSGHSPVPKAVSQKAHKTWLYVMQGWTNGPDGSPSQAQLLVGDYTQSGKASSMSVYATPVTFAHARPGSADDADDARQIAELSVWLPQSDRLVVLGTPQTKTVLYAKTGGDLIPEKTDDGVAVFPRTRELVKGRYADTIQVRDAKNVALTPPKAWSAADFALDGAMSLWTSGPGGNGSGSDAGGRWGTVPARPGAPARPTPVPSMEPPTSAARSKPGTIPAPSDGSASAPPSTDPGTVTGASGPTGFSSSF